MDESPAGRAPLDAAAARARARPVRQVRHRRRVQHAAHVRRLHRAAEGVRRVVPGGVGGRLRRWAPSTASCSTAAGPSVSTSATRSRPCAGGSCRAAASASTWACCTCSSTMPASTSSSHRRARPRSSPSARSSPTAPGPSACTRRVAVADSDCALAEDGQQRQARRDAPAAGDQRGLERERALEQPVERPGRDPQVEARLRRLRRLMRSSTRSTIAAGSSSELK